MGYNKEILTVQNKARKFNVYSNLYQIYPLKASNHPRKGIVSRDWKSLQIVSL
jgi:hypothetical protein